MKPFVIGSALACTIAAALAACSSSPTTDAIVAVDAAADAPVAKPDAARDTGVADTGPATCATPVKAADFTKYYKPTTGRVVGACTEAQLTAASAAKTDADLFAAIGEGACRSCAVSLETDAKWAPIVLDAAGKFVLFSHAACVEAATGDVACGKFQAGFQSCRFEACVTCKAAADQTACRREVYAGQDAICQKAASDDLFGSCSPVLNKKASDACGGVSTSVLFGSIRYMCGPATGADAGADGGDGGN
jgi:hypothetical protein